MDPITFPVERSGEPPVAVLQAFGVDEPARRLPGGQGTSWRAGGLVFKPEAGPLQDWLGETLATIPRTGFRLVSQAPTVTGAWSHDGWSATTWLEGTTPNFTDVHVWAEILLAARAFHRAVAHLNRPPFIDTRQDRWAIADRWAWSTPPEPTSEAATSAHTTAVAAPGSDTATAVEVDARFRPEFAPLAARLRRGLSPADLREPAQIVHADLAGNILFAPLLPPVVIDVSPYWRPVSFAEGMIVADALCWHDAPADLPARLEVPVSAVARALLFRMATTNQIPAAEVEEEAARYHWATTALGL
ncbi:hypothetical protein [Actinoplanes couchii]|uniref:hypothetical protein n=1 Tax=Actinoplanes couchii TaxID=403638 RepID=UPI0019442DE8|nr:hypothetical protein [Actinoplanes couchii]MDR6317740.1 uncharacterized protein (TIGR02569 family) [Actinoplanes couchii]